MELIVETEVQNGLSDYQKERGKPIPTLIHGAIKANLIFELKLNYKDKFRIASEVSLATQPFGSTPDLILYPQQTLDYKNDPSKREDAPLLTIEIHSAFQSTKEMVEKLEPYFDFGVKSFWIVMPNLQAILVYDSPSHYHYFHEDEILKDNILNIEIDLKKIFE